MNDTLKIDESTSLQLGRGVRLRHDRERDCWTLMAPERVIVLDEIAHQVIVDLVESDGLLAGVIDRLSQLFDAPRDEIASDVIDMLQPFVDKQLIRQK
jgi:pyrroloquinoline quinone biosynthesis protein D